MGMGIIGKDMDVWAYGDRLFTTRLSHEAMDEGTT